MAATARHSTLVLAPSSGAAGAKARHSTVAVASIPPTSRARHSSVAVLAAGAVARARHSTLTAKGGSSASASKFIMTAAGLVPLGHDTSTPAFPLYGPYGQLGAYMPGPGTSGVPADVTLTPLTGTQTITTPGTVIDGRDITGLVLIRAANVTIRNCIIRGTTSAPTASTGLINCGHALAVNAVIEDCTIIPQSPHYYYDGIQGHDYTARRCDISGVTDGFGVMNVNAPASSYKVHIEANYVHDHAYRATPSSVQSDLHTHNDGIQIHGGGDVWIVGNNLQSFTNPTYSDIVNPYASTGNQCTGQSIAVLPIISANTNVHILNNWIDGAAEGGVHSDVRAFSTTGPWGEVKRNRFGRNQRNQPPKYTIRVAAAHTTADIPLSGADANVYADDGSLVTVVRD